MRLLSGRLWVVLLGMEGNSQGESFKASHHWVRDAPEHGAGDAHCRQICAAPPGGRFCCREGALALHAPERGLAMLIAAR